MKDKLKSMAEVFKALGDQKRLMIIKMLASNSGETLCVTDVAKNLGITQPAATQHIRVLKNVGLLDENRKGYRVYYAINPGMMGEYKKEMDELFKKAFEKCPHDFSCSECEYNQGCGI